MCNRMTRAEDHDTTTQSSRERLINTNFVEINQSVTELRQVKSASLRFISRDSLSEQGPYQNKVLINTGSLSIAPRQERCQSTFVCFGSRIEWFVLWFEWFVFEYSNVMSFSFSVFTVL